MTSRSARFLLLAGLAAVIFCTPRPVHAEDEDDKADKGEGTRLRLSLLVAQWEARAYKARIRTDETVFQESQGVDSSGGGESSPSPGIASVSGKLLPTQFI